MKSVYLTIVSAVISVLMSLSALAQTPWDQFGAPENFSDVVLIYAGNPSRNPWTMEELRPYVTHRFSDGTENWFFDTFLFLEFVRTTQENGEKTSYGFGNGMGGHRPATQQDWKWILDEYFSIGLSDKATTLSPQNNAPTKLAALDRLIGEKITELGQPDFRHKVIVVCPAPKKDGTVWSSEIWGNIEGQQISLETQDNRLAAVKWYIDELMKYWDKAEFKNIDLEGIYWIEEGMISNAGIIADVNDYARSKGLHSYWIPYYRDGNEPYCERWQTDFKFDMCYFQPNYAFYIHGGKAMPKTQLYYTVDGARRAHAGLELEFETSGASNALHSVDAASHQRLNDYMDVYEEKGVIDNAGIACYVGSRGLNHMDESTDSVDHATLDRLARIVNARQKAKFSSKEEPKATITRNKDSVTFTTETPQGQMEYVFKNCMANDLFTFYSVTLDGQVVNSAEHSDNIGPFLILDKGWAGGNHLHDDGSRSAKTVSVTVSVDAHPLYQGCTKGSSMLIEVINELYAENGTIFAIENVKYLVAGNSIEVVAKHDFKIEDEMTVDRYYGMQSMFEDETQILAPGSKEYNQWLTPVLGGADNAIRIKKQDAPRFSVFVEKSPKGYQASYMISEGLGKREKLSDEDFIYVGNSYQKSYHKLMGSSTVKPGETTQWHGVYSWFKNPIEDTFITDSEHPIFEYPAYISGKPVIFKVDENGEVSQSDLD